MSAKLAEGLHYEKWGDWSDSAPVPVVLIRGLGRSDRYWMGLPEVIAETRPVLTVDARGLGRSTRPMRWRDTVWDLAEDMIEIMDAAGAKRAHVAGISLGAMIAAAMAIRHPNRVGATILGCTSLQNARVLRMSWRGIALILRAPFVWRRFSEHLLELLISDRCPEARRREILACWKKTEAVQPMPIRTIFKQLVAATRFAPWREISSLGSSALVVVGDRDVFVPAENSAMVARAIPGCEYVIIRDAGHEFTDDHVEESATLFLDFIRKHEARQ